MEGVAQVGVLAADFRTSRGELGIDERAGQRDGAAHGPRAQNQERRVDLLRDYVGIDENPRADDASHDEHGGVEQSEPSG